MNCSNSCPLKPNTFAMVFFLTIGSKPCLGATPLPNEAILKSVIKLQTLNESSCNKNYSNAIVIGDNWCQVHSLTFYMWVTAGLECRVIYRVYLKENQWSIGKGWGWTMDDQDLIKQSEGSQAVNNFQSLLIQNQVWVSLMLSALKCFKNNVAVALICLQV